MKKILEVGFWVSLAAFMVLGGVVVFGQIAGVLLNNGALVAGVDERFSDLAFSLSTVCAAFALALRYFSSPSDASGGEAK
ncbi:hypothetical protein [Nigerium massiliense]|uniref:hypothetical protein n=1 Tax=Nigerium massiliense TaxID=1522317 RepID=UPI00058D6CAC|nr:hypothetical protein [Nigerium massiliense]